MTAAAHTGAAAGSSARRKRAELPAVVVTEPLDAPTPNDLTLLLELVLQAPGHVALVALPDGNSSDLADTLLNALGRPGVERAVRRFLSADLSTLTPYLAGPDVRDILVFEAENLDGNSVEQLLAINTLCGIRTWLIPGLPLKRNIAEHLHPHARQMITISDAVHHWQRRSQPSNACNTVLPEPDTPCPAHTNINGCLSHLGRHLTLGHVPSSKARLHLSDLLRRDDINNEQRLALNVRHGRRTLVPAAAALHTAGISPTRQRAVTVGATALSGAGVTLDRTIGLAGAARTAVAMQRLHAQVVGQRSSEPLMTLDGNAVQAHVLEAMAGGLLRDI